MSIVNQPIKDRIGQRRISDDFVPVFDWKLAGHQGRADSVTVFEDFQEVPSLLFGEGREAPIIQHEQIILGDRDKQLVIAADAFGQGQIIEEPGDPQIEGGEAAATGLVCQRRAEITLAGASGAADQCVVVGSDPLTACKLLDQRFVEPAGMPIIDIFDAGILSKLRLLEPRGQARFSRSVISRSTSSPRRSSKWRHSASASAACSSSALAMPKSFKVISLSRVGWVSISLPPLFVFDNSGHPGCWDAPRVSAFRFLSQSVSDRGRALRSMRCFCKSTPGWPGPADRPLPGDCCCSFWPGAESPERIESPAPDVAGARGSLR